MVPSHPLFLSLLQQFIPCRLNGSLCPTYESASTRRFQYGRVDSIRASHPEALEWTKAMMNSNLGKEEKRNKLKVAIAKQTKVTKENIFGEGVDVPLLGKHKATLRSVNDVTEGITQESPRNNPGITQE
jgi:carnitine O-acetyltransferase